MHAIEKYIERREREREKVGFSPIGEREEEGVLTGFYILLGPVILHPTRRINRKEKQLTRNNVSYRMND